MESEARTRIWWAHERGCMDVEGSIDEIVETLLTARGGLFASVTDRFGDEVLVNPMQVQMLEKVP